MPTDVFYSYRRWLPHWRQGGAVYFLTWRLGCGQPDLTPEERTLVLTALRHFNHERYELVAFAVMNDHVHVVVQPKNGYELQGILHSWKSFTAREMQRCTGRKGAVWHREFFDRIVRDQAELREKIDYVLNNPHRRWPDLEAYPWVRIEETRLL